jgi:hypothetical protein
MSKVWQARRNFIPECLQWDREKGDFPTEKVRRYFFDNDWSINLLGYTEGEEDPLNPGELVTSETEITIEFAYPLDEPVWRTFTNPGGFTIKDFVTAVVAGYQKIYAEEKETLTCGKVNSIGDPCGRYGIWGHDFSNLYLETFHRRDTDIWELGIGS